MSESFKIQQNVKVGNDLINLRADNPDEFKSIADWVIENAALLVNVQTALTGVAAVAPLAGNTASVSVQQQAPAQQNNSGWGAPQQQQPPSFANPATQGPACQHGPMVARQSKPGAAKTWSGWFCPTPQGTPGQCAPQFNKR